MGTQVLASETPAQQSLSNISFFRHWFARLSDHLTYLVSLLIMVSNL